MRVPFTKIDIGIARNKNSNQRSWNPTDERWYSPFPWLGKNGQRVANPETATQVPPLFTGVRIITETLSSVPLVLYKRKSEGQRERAEDNGLYKVLKNLANPRLTSLEFRELLTGHMILRGNGFAQIIRSLDGEISGLYPLHPDRMELVFDDKLQEYVYKYQLRDGSYRKFLKEEIFHLRGPSSDGIWGISFVQSLKLMIEHNMTLDEYAQNFYVNNAAPSGVLQMSAGIEMSPKAKDNLREEWKKKYGAANSGSIAILEEGLSWQQIGMSSQDSQFIDTLKDARRQILGALRIPLYMAGDPEKMSFNSVEQLGIQFIVYTMLPYFVRWEQTIYRDLLLESERKKYYAEFLVEGLQRGDIISRYRAYAIGRQWGWLSVNDIRTLENLNTVDGGDVYLQPLNMIDTSLATDYLMKEDNNAEEPPGTKNELDDNSNPTLKNSADMMKALDMRNKSSDQGQFILSKIEDFFVKINEKIEKIEQKQGKTEQKEENNAEKLNAGISKLRSTNFPVFNGILARAMRKEAAAYATAQRKNKLDEFQAEFYPEHKEFLSECLSDVIRSYYNQIKILSESLFVSDVRSEQEVYGRTLSELLSTFDSKYKNAGESKAADFSSDILDLIEKFSLKKE